MNDEALTIPQFATTYKVGRTSVYEEISSGRLQTYKVGRRRYISRRAAAEWQHRLEQQSQQEVAAHE